MNLFFRVLRRRSDGYHEIASFFQAIDLYDRLYFEKSTRDELTCSDQHLECGDSNLIIRALRLFRNRFPISFGVKIHLEKRIPMQAGLGGGSSNAATTLWALNELASWPASLDQLIEMGGLLGSDVPFFFSSGSAYCTGKGDIFQSLSLPSQLQGWVVKPFYGLSTPLVYGETCIEECIQRDPLDALEAICNWPKNISPAFFKAFYNDLEPAAFRLEPRLLVLREKLQWMVFDCVTMTGSGAAFFCMGQKSVVNLEAVSCIPVHAVGRPLKDRWYGD